VRALFKNRLAAAAFLIALPAAAVSPLISRQAPERDAGIEPAWPGRINGRAIRELPLSDAERRFATDFPGRIKRFTDGRRILILRWVTHATRKLHPAADCFRGLGYAVHPSGNLSDADGREWGCFSASRGDTTLRVTERIHDAAGNSWTDAQAWFWAAALGRSRGPWWATTVVE
jgi:hypothetical protein